MAKKTGYDAWVESKKEGKSATPSLARNPNAYNQKGYTGKSATKKSYSWEKNELKSLPQKTFGKSYNAKFDTWAQLNGLSDSEAKEFRTWLDSKEDKVSTKNDTISGIFSALNKRQESDVKQRQAKQKSEEKKKQERAKANTQERDGLLGFLDRTIGRASTAMQKDILGEDFVNQQDQAYRAQAQRTHNTEANQMLNTTSRAPKGALEKVSDFAGAALGEVGPYMLGYGVADKSLKVAKGLNALKNPIAREFVRGSIAGAAVGTGKAAARDTFADDYGVKDYAKQIGTEALIGGASDAAISAILKGVKVLQGVRQSKARSTAGLSTFKGNVSDNVLERLKPVSKASDGVASPSAYRQTLSQNYDLPTNENFRMNSGDLANEIKKTSSQLESIKPAVNSYKQEFDDAVEQQYQYLKSSMNKGVETGTTSNGELGNFREVTGRYTVSNNPQWYRDFYTQTGRKPNDAELRALAQEQVRNGFEDELGSLPAWQPNDIQELEDSINELTAILKDDPTQETAIRPVLDALQQDRESILKEVDTSISEYDTLQSRLNKLTNAQRQVEQPSLDRLSNVQRLPNRLVSGQYFEPIEQAPNGGKEPDLFRVSDVLLDAEKQAQGNLETAMDKISFDPPKKNENRLLKMRTQFMDDLAPLEELEKQITGEVASAENSLYKQGRLFRGSAEKANLIVKEQIEPILRDLRKNNIDMKDASLYSLMVHAKDVNEKGINSGFTNAEINDVLQRLGSPEMEAIRQKMLKVNNQTLNMLSTGEHPVLSKESVQTMREKWPNYMSLFRQFDDDKVDFASGLSKAMSVSSDPIERLKGLSATQMEELKTVNPFESMIKNIYRATNVTDRNKVAAQLGNLAEHENAAGIIRKLESGEDAGRLNVITMLDNGKQVKYEVPSEVYKVMKDLDKESTATIIKILHKPASWLRGGATLTPEFSLRNPMRDVPQAFVVSESNFNPVTDFPVGLWQTIWKGKKIKIGNKEFQPSSGELYKQFIKENGGYGNIVSMDRDLHKDVLKKALTDEKLDYVDVLDPKTYAALLKKLVNPMNALRTIADTSETATKLGEFRAALRKGASPQEAAYRARDIMDYSRSGVSVRQANKIVAFMNANLQGKSKLYRSFKKNPAKVVGKAISAVTLPTIGAIAAQEMLANDKQKQVIDDAPQWLRDTFYLIPIPGTDQIARIPKPFDLAYPFSNTLERAFRFVKDNDEEAYNDFFKQSLSAAAIPVMITALAPIVEGISNYSFFRQGPIIPQREQDLEYPEQYDINTSEVAKLFGKGINQVTEGKGAFKNFGSPRVIDNTIQGYFAGLGNYTVAGIDKGINAVTDLFTDEERPERPAKNVYQQPLAKAFLVNQSSGSASLDKLYTLKDKLSKARATDKNNSGNEDYDYETDFQYEDDYDYINDAAKTIADINKEIRTIENSAEYNAKEKRDQINRLTQERNRIARQTVQGYSGDMK